MPRQWRVVVCLKGELEAALNNLERDHRFEVFKVDSSQPEHDRIIGQSYEEMNWGGGEADLGAEDA